MHPSVVSSALVPDPGCPLIEGKAVAPTAAQGRRLLFAVGVLLGVSGAALADDDDTICTDRPDFVESSFVVGAGRQQIETSLAYERVRRSEADPHAWTTPTLVRIGLGEALEARVETDGWTRLRSAGTTTQGMSELSLGTKWALPVHGAAGATQALLLHVDLPTGNPAFQGRGARPSLRWAMEWEPSPGNAIGFMPGVVWDTTEDGDRNLGVLAGLTYGHAWTDTLRSFVEVVGEDLRDTREAPLQARLDGGMAWLLSPQVQIDCAAVLGMTRDSPDLALTTGLSVRW